MWLAHLPIRVCSQRKQSETQPQPELTQSDVRPELMQSASIQNAGKTET